LISRLCDFSDAVIGYRGLQTATHNTYTPFYTEGLGTGAERTYLLALVAHLDQEKAGK
jgi:hypothetical protein